MPASFEITSEDLRRLCEINAFPIDESEVVFFGLRGCLPLHPNEHEFSTSRPLQARQINYKNPRCTIGQWKPSEGVVSVFPGSTVPTARYVESAVANAGQGTNQLLTGCYKYVKGVHNADSRNGHDAFRQSGNRIFRRTADDAIYESTDPAYIGNPWDNLHAGFGTGIDGTYSSAGCQVVVGFPECRNYNESGPWEVFQDRAYEVFTDQREFTYVLLNASEADETSSDLGQKQPLQLRCGSDESALPSDIGVIIRNVQAALRQRGFYSGPIDGDFGAGSALAALKLQKQALGATLADGIVGPITAEALGITSWPQI